VYELVLVADENVKLMIRGQVRLMLSNILSQIILNSNHPLTDVTCTSARKWRLTNRRSPVCRRTVYGLLGKPLKSSALPTEHLALRVGGALPSRWEPDLSS
jgi:hypothetical protein